MLYTYDAPIGGTAAGAGTTAARRRPAPTTDGCVVSGRLVAAAARRRRDDRRRAGADQRLVPAVPEPLDRRLAFGPDGALYASAGDGASFNYVDYGQGGTPDVNPCGDPPGRRRRDADPADGRGRRAAGAGRSRTAGDRSPLDGTVIRVDPATGAALAGNPYAASADANARRIVAYGLPQPVPVHVPPGHQRALGRRRRLEHVGGDRPDRRPDGAGRRTSAGPATRAPRSRPATSALNLNLCNEPVHAGTPRPRRTTPTTTPTQRRRRRRRARPAARRSRASRSSTGGTLPGGVQRRAVLRRLHRATASG